MSIVKLILHSLVMIFTCTQVCHSASLHLTWNGNTETDLEGYKIYYGTSPGSYGNPVVLGDVTEYELSGLAEGTMYYVALTAFDTSDNESEKSLEESGVAHQPPAGTELANGIQDGGSVEPQEEDLYHIDIPAGQGYLLVELTGNPDADLYVRYGLPPTTAQSDCRPYTSSSNELCSFSDPDSGIWYIMVQGYSDTVDYTITATYNTGPPPITTTTTTTPPPPTTTTSAPPSTTTAPVTTTAPPSTTTAPVTTTAPPSTTTAPVTTTAPPSTTTAPVTTTTPPSTTTAPVTTTAPPSTTTAPVTTTAPPSTTTAPVTTTAPPSTTTAPVTTTVASTTSIPSATTTTISSIDTTPPSGTVIINNGVAVTYSRNVILSVSARDDGQELDKNGYMSFSNDGLQWSDPEPYTTAKLWTLTPDEGTKTVYAQFRDAAGNWMTEPAQDHIIYNESESSCNEPQRLFASATKASSQFLPFFSKENAIDGNPSTTWSTPFSFFKKDEFITLDLGDVKRISRFTMQAASTLFGTDLFPVNFKIEISRDNMTWEKISTEENYTPPIQSAHSDSWDLNSIECRYIRVYITKAKTIFFFFKMAQIAEIEVYGCTITDDIPLLAKEDPSLVTEDDGKQTVRKQKESGGQKDLQQMLPTIPGRPTITLFK